MPPRFSYWTIIAGGLPTAFRATDREELLPTFSRLKEKHPDAEMKWFARGKLWNSPEDASRDNRERARGADRTRDARGNGNGKHRHRDREAAARGGEGGPPRGPAWRPGGEHRDPRQKYKDAKKARNIDFRREKFLRKNSAEHDRRRGDEGRNLPPERRPSDRPERPWSPEARPRSTAPGPGGKSFGAKPAGGGWRRDRNTGGGANQRSGGPRPRLDDERPHGDPLAPEHRSGVKGSRQGDPRGSKPQWQGKPREQAWREKPDTRGNDDRKTHGGRGRGWTPKPPSEQKRPWTPQSRRDEERPHGDPLAPEHRSGVKGSRQGDTRGSKPQWQGKPREQAWREKPDTRGNNDRKTHGGHGRGWTPKPPSEQKRPWTPQSRRDEERPHGDPLAPEHRSGVKGSRQGDSRAPKPEWRDRPREPRQDRPWTSTPPEGRGGRPFRGAGHGDNSWKPRPPRDQQRDSTPASRRPFEPRGGDRDRTRGAGTEEPQPPPRPRGPNREPRPSEQPKPSAPPRPSEPAVPPPGPPERGRLNKNKRAR